MKNFAEWVILYKNIIQLYFTITLTNKKSRYLRN